MGKFMQDLRKVVGSSIDGIKISDHLTESMAERPFSEIIVNNERLAILTAICDEDGKVRAYVYHMDVKTGEKVLKAVYKVSVRLLLDKTNIDGKLV